jgi:hypothetical protein
MRECEFAAGDDPGVLKILLKGQPGLGEGLRLGRVRRVRRRLADPALRRERRVTANPLLSGGICRPGVPPAHPHVGVRVVLAAGHERRRGRVAARAASPKTYTPKGTGSDSRS